MQQYRVPDFIKREESFNGSRQTVMFAPSQSIEPGQIVQARGAPADGDEWPNDLMFTALDLSAIDIEHQVLGIAVYRVITTVGSTVKSPVIVRNSVVHSRGLIWPTGIAAELEAAVTERLRMTGILLAIA